MSMPQQIARWEHEDAQNDRKVIAVYDDLGLGPMVVFDGGGYLSADALDSFIDSLKEASVQLHDLRLQYEIGEG